LVSRPISRTEIIIAKFLAGFLFTFVLLIWMAVCSLFLSLLIFGSDDMLVFRSENIGSSISQISSDDIMWRYLFAFGYAVVALTVISALAMLMSIFADNSIGPIIACVCLVIVCTIITNMNVPIIDKYVKPFLFTSYLVGWKGFFYIDYDANNQVIKGSVEDMPSILKSLAILVLHIFLIVWASVYFFKRKDILS
jgi:ABC-2 type transport system permease protein